MFRMGSSYEPHGLFRGRLAGLPPVHDDLPPAPPVSQADNEEDEDRGRWREARCNSSDGLGWDKTSTERTTVRTTPGIKAI